MQEELPTARLWNTASARSVAELPIWGVEDKFFQDGRRLLCEDQEVRQLHLVVLNPVIGLPAIFRPAFGSRPTRDPWLLVHLL